MLLSARLPSLALLLAPATALISHGAVSLLLEVAEKRLGERPNRSGGQTIRACARGN
jgi:hypothetical protein